MSKTSIKPSKGAYKAAITGRVGRWNRTTSPSQIPYVNLSIHTARVNHQVESLQSQPYTLSDSSSWSPS